MSDDSTVELVSRFRAGDETAATVLFDRFACRLLALIRKNLSPKLAARLGAEDVAQSAFNSFFGGVRTDRFTFQRGGDAWKLLVQIAINKVHWQAKHHQQQKRALSREESPPPDSDDLLKAAIVRGEPDPSEAAAAWDELTQVIGQFGKEGRLIIELGLQGTGDIEIASQVGCAEYLVRRTWNKFRALLEKRLQSV